MKRMLIVGLDGVTWKVIKPWVDKGELSTFHKLMENGSWGILESTLPPLTSPAIPSLVTGKNPAKLGFFDFVKPDGKLVTHLDIKEAAIWDILGEHGYKSMIVNLRTTYPPKKMCGIMISGMPPSEETTYTYPRELKCKVAGFHRENEELIRLWRQKTFKQDILPRYVKSMWRRYQTVKDLAAENDYDLILYWIEETDVVQHWYWHREHLLRAFFLEVDKILNDISKSFPDRELILVSDHGFHSLPVYSFHPNSWLRGEGYLKLKGGEPRQRLTYLAYSFAATKVGAVLVRYIRLLQRRIESAIRRSKRSGNLSHMNLAWGVDPHATLAAASDRNPLGIWVLQQKSPSMEQPEKIREEIMSGLRKLEHNGERILAHVWKREDVYKGRYVSCVPDIVYLPTERFTSTTALSRTIVKKRRIAAIGTHINAREGIFLACGRDFKRGMNLGKIAIEDIAPTVLHFFEIPVSQDMDGRVLREMIEEESELAKKSVEYEEYTERVRIQKRIKELRARRRI